MGVIDLINEMKLKEQEREKERQDSLVEIQSKKRLENHQKGRWYIFELLKEKGFNVTPKMKAKGTEIHSLIIKKVEGTDLILDIHTQPIDQEGYIMNDGDEKKYSKNLYHIFVDFTNNDKFPDYWIVPSEIAAKMIKESHEKWLATPGLKNRKHNDNSIRVFYTKNIESRMIDWEKELKNYYKNIEQLKK